MSAAGMVEYVRWVCTSGTKRPLFADMCERCAVCAALVADMMQTNCVRGFDSGWSQYILAARVLESRVETASAEVSTPLQAAAGLQVLNRT